MKLSIITINCNNLEGLRRTINSVVSQTFLDYEWIVIDGGSTDGSKELIEAHSDRITYWVSEKDSGVYHAMNKGFRQAHGEWLLFLNSGDALYECTTLAQVFSAQHEADILFGNALEIHSDHEYLQRSPKELSFMYLALYSICHQACFIRRECFADGLYCEDYRIVSDWVRFLQWMLEGKRFKHLEQTIVRYDMEGISSKQKDLLEEEKSRALQSVVPQPLLIDIEKEKARIAHWGFIEQHRSMCSIINIARSLCKGLDKILK